MKFTILICLLGLAIVSANHDNGIDNGSQIPTEPPHQLGQCPAYDDPNHIVMFAYPNDCRKYYTCMKGLAYLNQCPDNYYWSQLTYRCDYKQYSNCGTTDFPDNSQAVRYSAYPGDCTRYYETRTLRCPNNYHWNEHHERCDLPQFAGCTEYPATLPPGSSPAPVVPTAVTAPPTSQPTTQPDTPYDPEYLCKNSGNMPYLPYPGDCQKFIYCGPTPSVLTCPSGLYWNRNTQSCGSTNMGCTK